MSSKMAELQKTLPADVRLVTFTVDPDRDDQNVLAEYARHFEADPAPMVLCSGGQTDPLQIGVRGVQTSHDGRPVRRVGVSRDAQHQIRFGRRARADSALF
jgi:cytochrome oxidase Cu insertion factor (SCO1/SenC/PrrC family)